MDNYINITKNVLLKNRDPRIIDDLDVLFIKLEEKQHDFDFTKS